MSFSRQYLQQVELLLKVLPIINQQDCFALKGGTAINLFIRDMPRLSVDIDLTYLPIEPREQFLKNLTIALNTLGNNIAGDIKYQISKFFTKEKQLSKLVVSDNFSKIIIEPNFILRGSVFECEFRDLCESAQDEFLSFFSIKTLSFADLYGGKICAALARQHPRDLFDIKYLLDNDGITQKIRMAFIVYLISSNRPIHELLAPNQIDQSRFFENEFKGMTKDDISYKALEKVRIRLIKTIQKDLTERERQFILSVQTANPEWELLPLKHIKNLPAVKWKLENIKKIEPIKNKKLIDQLREILQI